MLTLTPEMKARLAEMKAEREKVPESTRKKMNDSVKRGASGNTTILVWLDEEFNKTQNSKVSQNGNTYWSLRGRVVFPFHSVQNFNGAQVFNHGTSMLLFCRDGPHQEISLGGTIKFNVYTTPTVSGIVKLSIYLKKGEPTWPDPITGETGHWCNINIAKNGIEYVQNVACSDREMYHPLLQVFNVTPLRSIPLSEIPTQNEVDDYLQKLQAYKKPKKGNMAASSSSGPLPDRQLIEKYDALSNDQLDELLTTCSDDERKKLTEELSKYEELKKKEQSELEESNRERSYTRCFQDKLSSDTHRSLLEDNALYYHLGECSGIGHDGLLVMQHAPEIVDGAIVREISDSFSKKHPTYPEKEIMTCNVSHSIDACSVDGEVRHHLTISTMLWHIQMHKLCGIGLIDTAKKLFPKLFRSSQAILQSKVQAKDTVRLKCNTAQGAVRMNDGERATGWFVNTFGVLSMDPFAPLLAEGFEVTPRFAFQLMQQHMQDYGKCDKEEENSVDTQALLETKESKKATRFSAGRRKALAFAIKENPYHKFTDGTIRNLTESNVVVPNGTEKRNKSNLYFVVSNAFSDQEETSGVLGEARAFYETYYNEPDNKKRRGMGEAIQSVCEGVSEFLSERLLGDGRKQDLEIALFQVSRRIYEAPQRRTNTDLSQFTQRPPAPADDDDSEVAQHMRERIQMDKRTKQEVLQGTSPQSASSSSSSSAASREAFVHDSQPTPEDSYTPTMEDDQPRSSSKRKHNFA